jgi:hypothetical protein
MQLACNWLLFTTILVMFTTTNLVLYNFWAIRLCVQLNVYNMDMCHKNNGLNLYMLKLLYLIYVHMLYIIILCTSSTMVNPMLT